MSYREVNTEDIAQERDINVWQGMNNSLAYLAAKRNAIDSYRRWEGRYVFGGDMEQFSYAETNICSRLHENELIQDVLNCLDEREHKALIKRYVEGYTLKEIGKLFSVGEARACQICKEAIRKIRRRYGHCSNTETTWV